MEGMPLARHQVREPTEKMPKISEVMIEILRQNGVRLVFGIPSIHNIGLYDALRKEPAIRHILCRHESSATHMADGYARAAAGGRPGVVITSTGPGAGYMVSPLMEAWWSSSPVLAITTNVRSNKIDKQRGTLHETFHQDAIFHYITKARVCVRRNDNIEALINQAVQTALFERPGPVYVEVPTDLWDREATSGDVDYFEKGPEHKKPLDLDQTISMLRQADRPVMVVGMGAVRARMEADVVGLAEALLAPVLTVAQAKGIVPEDHPLSFGNVCRRGVIRRILESSDVTLALGTRLREVDAKRQGLSLANLIHVDWEPCWMGKNFPAQVQLVGDIAAITRRLRVGLETQHPFAPPPRIRRLKREFILETQEIAKARVEVQYLDVIRQALPRDGDLVVDNTLLGYWAEYFYSSHKSGGLVSAKGTSIIGFAFPAAVGLKLADPHKAVVSVIGDGGFLYGASELATCVRHGIGFPLIVVNDGAYGIIDTLQRSSYGKGYETRLVNPNLTAYAKSFGIKAISVGSPANLGEAVEMALKSQEMWLIELVAAFPDAPFALY